jgi:hypothetical protein
MTQYGHNTCALFALPHELHLFRAVTSFNALPAICLCLFFMCDVFFLGTALSIPSHRSESSPGIGIRAAGSRGERRNCWRSGIRLVNGCPRGNSCARAMGRNADKSAAVGLRSVAMVQTVHGRAEQMKGCLNRLQLVFVDARSPSAHSSRPAHGRYCRERDSALSVGASEGCEACASERPKQQFLLSQSEATLAQPVVATLFPPNSSASTQPA